MVYVTVNVDPTDVLDDLSTEDLIEEILSRGPRPSELDKLRPLLFGYQQSEFGRPAAAVDDVVRDALAYCFRNQEQRALKCLHDYMAMTLPPNIVAAKDHLENGRRCDAICELDDYLAPYIRMNRPATKAKSTPVSETAPHDTTSAGVSMNQSSKARGEDGI